MFTLGPAFRYTLVDAVTDQYFNNVKLFVTGAGADNSTTFTDISPLAQTVTTVGNTKVSGNYILLDGSGDYLSVPNSANVLLGNNDFTIELTIDAFSNLHSENILFGVWANGGQLSYLSTIDNSNRLTFYYSSDGSTGTFTAFSSTSVSTAGGPKHLAVTRNNGVVRIFIDGVKRYEGTHSATFFTSTHVLTIGGVTYTTGSDISAKLKNIRLTKGVARYLADFTVPSTYGTAAPSWSARYYESNGDTTLSGSNRVATFSNPGSSFGLAHVSRYDGTNEQLASHSKSYIEFAIGGDSKGTFIGLLDNSDFSGNFPTNLNPVGTPGFYLITCINYFGINPGLITNGALSNNSAYDYNLGDVIGVAVNWITGGVWFKKISTGWISGDPEAGTSPTFTLPHSNFSFVVGSYARSSFTYTATLSDAFAYTPPTDFTPVIREAVANPNLSLLLHSTTDSAPSPKALTLFGTTAVSTSQYKYGPESIEFFGSSDRITTPHHTSFDVGSGAFTIELHVRFKSISPVIILNKAVGTGFFPYQLWVTSASKLAARGFDVTEALVFDFATTASVVIDTWYHLALVRLGNTISFYVNGALVSSATVTTALHNNASAPLSIGAYENGIAPMNGYVDEVRILKGECAYTTPFTPRSVPYLTTD